MTRIFLHQPDYLGCSYYRAYLPHKFCQPELAKEGITLDLSPSCTDAGDYDAYLFHKLFAPPFIPAIEKFKRMGRRICWATDDDILNLPSWNPASRAVDQPARDILTWSMDLADAICVSTEPLAQVVNRPEKTWVCPNLLDLQEWPAIEQQAPHDKIRILWAGSIHHDGDLDQVVEPLEEILAEYPDQVQVYFMGDWPERMTDFVRLQHTHLGVQVPHARYQNRVGFIDHVELKDYPRTIQAIRPDIALAPLCDHAFNNSKSGIKYYEMVQGNAAVVATDLPPYQCVKSGVDGILVKPGDAQGWYEAIKTLIEEPELRRLMNALARRKVEEEFSWQYSPHKETWLDFFRSL